MLLCNEEKRKQMKVKLNRDIYDWRRGVPYYGEPIFYDNEQRVKVHLPNSSLCVLVKWDDIETAE